MPMPGSSMMKDEILFSQDLARCLKDLGSSHGHVHIDERRIAGTGRVLIRTCSYEHQHGLSDRPSRRR